MNQSIKGFLSSSCIDYHLSSSNEVRDTSKWCTFYKHSYNTGTNTAECDHLQHWQLRRWSPAFYAKGRFSHIPSHMLQKLNSPAADILLIGYMQNTWIWCTAKVWHIFKCNECQGMQCNKFILSSILYSILHRVYSVDAHLLDSMYHSKGLLLDINCNSLEPELQHCQWHHMKTVSCSLYLGVHCAGILQ